jgi:PAS domain S-box-containing protein
MLTGTIHDEVIRLGWKQVTSEQPSLPDDEDLRGVSMNTENLPRKHGLPDFAVIGFGLTLAVLLVGGVLGFVSARRLSDNEQMVAHTHEVIGELEALLSTLKDAETGQRGYLLTEDAKYLQPYEDALKRLQATVAHLNELVHNPDQQARLAELETNITPRLEELRQTVALVKQGDRPAAMKIVRSDTGKAMMDDLRERVAAMRQEEDRLLRQRADESKASFRTTVVSILLSAVIGVVLVSVVFYLSRRNLLIRQRAAEVLAEEKERLRTTLASIGDAVISTDGEGRITNMNAVAESLTGWNKEEAACQHLDTVFRIVNEKTRQPVHNPATKAMKEGIIVGLANHTTLIAKGGVELAIDDSAAPIRCAKGEVVGCVLVFRDVTEHRRMEMAARSLASIVEHSDDAIIGKDVNGIITSWNQGAERIFGYTDTEAVGHPIAMLAPPDRADEMPDILQRIRRGERVDHFDTVRRAKDGRLVPISLTVSPIKDDDGKIVGASKIARDISERKRAQAALHEEKERLHATLTGIGDAVVVTDSERRVTMMNAVAQVLTGWQEEAAGRPLEEVFCIINEQTRQPVESPVSRVIREGTVVGLANHTVLIAKSGGELPIDDSAAPIRDGQGHVIGCVLVFRDITERRRADQQVADEKARIESIVNHVIDGIIAIDENGTVDAFNPAAERLFGYGQEEVIGQNVKMLMPEPFHNEHDGYLANYQRTGQAKIIGIGREVEGRRKDGSIFPMDLAVSEFWVGKRRYFTGLVRDITERKKAEAAAHRHKEILQLVHRIGKIGHWEWNSLTDENKWSPEIEALYGLKPGTFGGTYDAWTKLLHPDDLPKQEEAVRRALETGQYFTEFRVIWPDGSVHWLEARANVFKDGHDKPVRIMGVNMDVTERKRAEEQLRASEQRLAAEVEALSRLHALSTRLLAVVDVHTALNDLLENAIVTCEADFGNVQLYNPQIKALEIVAQRAFKSDFLDYFHTVRVDDGSACAQAMQTGEHCIIEDVQEDPAFEPHRSIAAPADFRGVHSTPLKDRNGGVIGMLSVHFRQPHGSSEREQRFLDLYARHAADLIERSRFEEALKEADRRKDEFLAMLAHELRNPLAPIRNGLQLMRLAKNDAPTVEQTRTLVERQFSQLVHLVDDLMDVSRISRGMIELRKQPVEMAPVVSSAVEASRPFIEQMGHELTVIRPKQPVVVDADLTRLAQVFINLLNNAAKYSNRGGHIWLTVERQGSDVVVSVKDTGIGIDANHLARIFDPFMQIDRSLEKSQGGLGIGLTLVKRLVEMHGGRIEAKSDGLGKGSEFVVRLPVVVEASKPSEPTKEDEPAVPRSSLRILIVDDNRDGANSLAMLLRIMGNDTHTAYDGQEGVEVSGQVRPDVVLLDIGLPKLNGYEACRRIREQSWGKNVVLIAVTGWGQEEDRRRSHEAGFDHHMVKPVEPQALMKLLSGLNVVKS